MIILSTLGLAFSTTKNYVFQKTGSLFTKVTTEGRLFLDISGNFFDAIHMTLDDIDVTHQTSPTNNSLCKKIATVFTSCFKAHKPSESHPSKKKNELKKKLSQTIHSIKKVATSIFRFSFNILQKFNPFFKNEKKTYLLAISIIGNDEEKATNYAFIKQRYENYLGKTRFIKLTRDTIYFDDENKKIMITIPLEFFQDIPDRDPDTRMSIIEIDWTHMELEYKFFGISCDITQLQRAEDPRQEIKKTQ